MDARASADPLDLAAAFVALPTATAIFAADAPHFTVLAASDALLATTRRPRAAVVGRPLAEAWPNATPEDPGASGLAALRASLDAALRTGAPQAMARQRYDVQRPDGAWEARYWDAVNIPVRGPDGAVRHVLHQTVEVTAQVQADAALARATAHDAYRVALTDALRAAPDAGEVQAVAMRVLGDHLAASRVVYGEADPGSDETFTNHREYRRDPAMPTSLGQHRWDDFGARVAGGVRAGRTLAATDVRADPAHAGDDLAAYDAVGVRAYIAVPVVRAGRTVAYLAVNQTTPRAWAADEIALVEETAERTWAAVERARAEAALREREARLAAIFAQADVGLSEVSADGRFLRVNDALCGLLGRSREELLTLGVVDVTEPEDVAPSAAAVAEALTTGGPTALDKRYRRPDGTRVWARSSVTRLEAPADAPAGAPEGGPALLVATVDLTARVEAEAARRAGAERQAFLLALSDALRAEPDADAIARRALRMLAERLQADRCYVGVYRVDEDRGEHGPQVGNDRVAPVPDVVRLSDFPEAVRSASDATLVLDDVAATDGLTDVDRRSLDAVGIRALVVATLRHGPDRPLWCMVAVSADPRRWTPAEVALVEETAERTWAAMERARAEAALRESEAKYRTLFETMGQGYSDLELLRDAEGRIVDERWLALNPAFERIFGIPVARAVGRRRSEIFPGLEPWWEDAFDRVARTGVPERVEYESPSIGGWYEMSVYPRGGDRLIVLYEDITERKRAEVVRRESEARQAFLLALSDILQRLTAPLDVKAAAARMLGTHLRVSRVQYHEVDESGAFYSADGVGYADGLPLLDLKYRIDQFGSFVAEDFEAGRPFRSDDLLSDPRPTDEEREAYRHYGIRAALGIPLLRGGRLVAILAVHDRSPHPWTDLEVELVRETAERVWVAVERVRTEAALRQSEEQFRRAIEEAPIPVVMHAEDGEVLQVSRTWTELTGWTLDEVPTFDAWLTRAYGEGGDDVRAHVHALFAGDRRTMSIEFPVRTRGGELRHWSFSASAPGTLHDGRRFVVGMALDVTERTRVEEALRASEARLAAVLEALPVGVGLHDTDGYLVLANAEMLQRYLPTRRMPSRDAERRARWRAWEHDGRAVAPSDLPGARALRGERVLPGLEMLYRQDDGREVWTRVAAVPVRDATGAVTGVVAAITDIDALKRATEALGASEERYRLIVEGARDYAILTTDADGTITSWSPGAAAVYGWPVEEAEGASVDMTFVDEDRAAGVPAAERAEARASGVALDVRWHRCHDGRRVFIEGVTRALWDDAGRLRGFLKIGQDVTRRREVDEALRASEARYRTLVATLPGAAVFVFDAALRYRLAGGEAFRAAGFTPDRFLGRSVVEVLEPALAAEYVPQIRRALGGAPFEQEHAAHGRIFLSRGAPLAEAADGVSEALVVSIDVTDRRRAEQALRASEMRYRTLVENVRDYAIFLVDAGGIVIEWTGGAARVKGYAADEVVGRHFALFYTPDDAAAGEPARELAEAAATGRAEREGWRVRKGGARFWVNEIATAIRDADGRLVGFTKISRDLTERRLAEAAAEERRLTAARDELRRALAAAEEGERRRLARELHDQLGQHLTGFTLALGDLRRRLTAREPVERRLDALEDLARLMMRDARTLALELRPPELDDVGLASALATYVGDWGERAAVATDVAVLGAVEAVPAEIGSALYRIAQEALTNVARHARATQVSIILEHRPAATDRPTSGAPQPEARLTEAGTAEAPPAEVRLLVEDDGRGFDVEATDARVRAERRLGLAGMRERAALVGGTLTVESSPGAGTTLHVRIPLRVAEPPAPPPSAPTAPPPAT